MKKLHSQEVTIHKALDRLLPKWSISVLVWVACLWLAAED
ncbi:hypothetical protein HMPREF9370_2346 [Neisseria wadsworthii 9715]|uniref:Uncharacterized protein n=1 Tax=Neisseria wadsworthii 9715 TaxID=1030841 RepID=G4CTD6_9NEIS|nr:hypothetical protein HMPREF9370_2346 [Neisseria wadsworthii 9715]